jgi:hypothetical protein
MTQDEEKSIIVERFRKNVLGRRPTVRTYNKRHDGSKGHWLEVQMGISHNSNGASDFCWFEMKDGTRGKTTFGDWSADSYIFNDSENGLDRDKFMEIFGQYNEGKDRHSWSGKPIPKINTLNDFGQCLVVTEENNIIITYSFTHDERPHKRQIVPINLQRENLILATWAASSMQKRVESKFNKAGWFRCKKNSSGIYDSIAFGRPIDYLTWINEVRKGVIFFDSGMHKGNSRNYSQWRASNAFWDSMTLETIR